MARRINENLPAGENALLVCGRHHQENLADMLKGLGHTVDLIDLKERDWYSKNWAEDY